MNDNTTNYSDKLEGGLCIKGVKKDSYPGKPLVTIITATFNAAKYLYRTINSIRNLTYENIEWIILDGGSSDGTVELIRHNEDIVDYWSSQPDAGIYDAWNKGILLANGDWISFLGAGDCYMPEAIDIYVNAIHREKITPELVSSRVRFVSDSGYVFRVWGAPFEWELFKRYMNIAHVGALHHRSLFERLGLYNTEYTSSADYDLLMRCGGLMKTVYVDVVTADVLVGGVSYGYSSLYETYIIQKYHGAGISAKYGLWLARLKRFIRPLLRGY
jgi:glycosyltransferase involved in cell wall biosynthesis